MHTIRVFDLIICKILPKLNALCNYQFLNLNERQLFVSKFLYLKNEHSTLTDFIRVNLKYFKSLTYKF
jgi:hypothetical protein